MRILLLYISIFLFALSAYAQEIEDIESISEEKTNILKSPKIVETPLDNLTQKAPEDTLSPLDGQGTMTATAGGSDYSLSATWSGFSNPCVIPTSTSGSIAWSPGYADGGLTGNANSGTQTVLPGPGRKVDFTHTYNYSGTLCSGTYTTTASATTAALKNPTSFTASDGSSDYYVDLNWSKGTNTPSTYVTYYIYRNGSFFTSTSATSYRANLTPGQSDSWNVRTHSTYGGSFTSGGVSNNGSTSGFRAPYSQSASYETYIGKIVLSWASNSDYANSFRIYRDGALIATVPRTTLSYTDQNIINGEEYTYTIKSYNSGSGVESAGVNVTGKTYPMFPNSSDGTYNNRVKVSWRNVASFAEEIKILRGNEEIGITSKNATSYFDYDAVPGKLYQYSIIPLSGGAELGAARDYGFIRPDGKISGKIKTIRGAGIQNVEVTVKPAKGDSSRSLLFDNTLDYMIRKPIKSFAENAFTLSFWMKSGATAQTGSIFSYANPTSDNALLIFNPTNFEVLVNGTSTGPTGVSATDNIWHHITVTWQNSDGQVRLLKDGVQVYSGSIATGATLQNGGSIVLGQDQDAIGGGFDPNQAYLGQLDEIQLWNNVLSDSIINAQMNLTLRGDEDGLVSYWSFDTQGRQPVNIAGDFSKAGGNHLQGYSTTFSTDHSPVKTLALTDPTGFYSVNNIYDDGSTAFDVSVFKLRHGFDPTSQERTLELNSPVADGVDFTDTTSFAISGKIVLNGTSCAVAGVDIRRNGDFTGIKTNAQGEFVLSIEEPGNYTITPVFGDTSFPHVFEPAEIVLNVTDDVENVNFNDMTTSLLAGRVGGGCDAFIGRANISIVSKDQPGCYNREVLTDVNGNYSINLPSQKYIVEVLSLDPPNPVITDVFPIVITDLTFQDTTLNYTYRNPPQIKVTGFPAACAGAAPFNVPVISQYDVYTFQIEVFEEYNGDTCLVDTGFVKIFDDLGGNAANPVTLTLSNGTAYYTTQIGEPNILDGGAHPFQKLFQVTAQVEEKNASFEQWALITGHKPRERTFVTKTPELPLLILRDPPGDESYAYFEKGTSTATNFKMSHQIAGSAGAYLDMKIGAGIPIPFTGIVIGAYTKIEGQILAGRDNNNGTTFSTNFSQNERLSTSGGEGITGEKGDIFMGASFNLTYALTDVIAFDETNCTVVQDTSVAWGAEDINTTYIYTEDHIRNTLLPNLRLLRSLASPDSVTILGTFIDVWEQVLEKNNKQKEEAVFERNISFSAGTNREYSETTSKDTTNSIDFTIFIDAELKIGAGIGDGGKFASTEFGVASTFRWSTSESRDTTNSTSTKVGYVLADNDPGDFFSVDVKKDKVYGTPVFALSAGTSSCPWEPGTQPRDGVNLAIDKFEQSDVPPFEQASFVLNLGNLSQSGETRDYKLSVIQSSNYDGAVISVGGVVIEDFLDYTIPAGQQITATMAVSRGPIAYSYENLQLRLYAPCDPSIADTVTFSVNYQSPCSNVALFKPDNNWLVNQASNDSLLIIIREYDPLNDKLESVSLQYRKIGESWKSAFALLRADLPPEYIYEYWNVASLADGKYELRAVTKCGTDGVNYSSVSSGVIDRSNLLVFGSPQPADGVLNIGEDILINFTSNLNCPQVSASKVKMINNTSGNEVPVTVACSDKTIIITPQVDIATLERESLTVTVQDIEDKNGNRLKEPVSWSFVVNQNALHWIVSNANRNVYKGARESFKTSLINVGGAENSFTLSGLPAWLTADPLSANIPAGGSLEISFQISDQLEQGAYLDTVLAQVNGQGDDPLFINVNVLSEPPAWAFNPADYQYSMDIIAQLKEGAGFAKDEKDIVAAFVGNEIRGKVNLTYVSNQDNHLAFLTIYSNQQSGETITFRSWDASEGEESGFIKEKITFENNSSVGLLLSPFVLTPAGKAQNITLNPNWTWFSLNLEYEDMSVDNVLTALNASPGDVIKGQQGIATYTANNLSGGPDEKRWIGDLQNLEVGKSYRVYLANQQNLRFAGDTVNVSQTSIPVFKGWNWVGYLPQNIQDINKTFKNFTPGNGDRLKGQNSFSVYDGSTGSWQGGLAFLNPGEGYMLKSSQNGFVSFASGNSTIAFGEKSDDANAQQANVTVEELSPYNYEHNMSIIGSVLLGGTTIRDTNFTVAAFVNDSLRGKAQVKYFPEVDKALIFMSVYSNKNSGEEIRFEVSNSSNGVLLPVTTTLEFTPDGIVGSIDNPFGFSGVDEVAPQIRSAFLYSTEPGLADHVRLYVTANEVLKEAPLVRVVSPTGKEEAFSSEVFDAGDNIYLAKYHITEFGENSFYISASDLSENLTQDLRKLNVNQINFGKSSSIALNEKIVVKLNPRSFVSNGVFYSESYNAVNDSVKQNLMRISENILFSASSDIDQGFDINYNLKDVNLNEEEKRKIGLYRFDNDKGHWSFVGGQSEKDRFDQKIDQMGVYALFYDSERIAIPNQFRLHQNFPNPFNPVTTIRFDLPEKQIVALNIYNVLGQNVKQLIHQQYDAGYHKVEWNGLNENGLKVASGIYIYQLKAGKNLVNKKMILIK